MPITTEFAQIARIVEDLASLSAGRNSIIDAANTRLIDLVRLDERIEAHVDAMKIDGMAAWQFARAQLDTKAACAFFAAAVLAVADDDRSEFEDIIEHAVATEPTKDEPYEPAYDPWRGLVSALAWVARGDADRAIGRLLRDARPRCRWLAIAACGARRGVREGVLEGALGDAEALVRARANCTAGELGRADVKGALAGGLREDDPECRFWAGWAAGRMGASEALHVLAEIAWQGGRRAERALDLLLRRLEVARADSWLREFAKLPGRSRDLIRATGVIGDPLYVPWLIERMAEPASARLAGEAFSMITGVDLAYRDLDRRPPADFESGPNDDPADENVALDEDERLPWPDAAKIGDWWARNRVRFDVGAAYFLGEPKANADWLASLSDAFQRQRRAAALELAIRQPDRAMFEVRARGRLQRQLLVHARGGA